MKKHIIDYITLKLVTKILIRGHIAYSIILHEIPNLSIKGQNKLSYTYVTK